MIITVVVSICHVLAGAPPVCRETIVTQGDMPLHACTLSQAALADWKSKSVFAGDQWTIARIKCVPGDYVIKDQI